MKTNRKVYSFKVDTELVSQPYVVTDSEGDQYVKTRLVEVPVEPPFKGVKGSDFALENVVAAGATQMLKPSHLTSSSLADVDSTTVSAEDFVASLENNSENIEE